MTVRISAPPTPAAGCRGGDYVGGLIGFNDEGAISDTYATGHVDGGSWVGGLIGSNGSGGIADAWASGDVLADGDYVGGLVGESFGDIENVSASGTVIGLAYVGGLIGRNGGGTMTGVRAWGSTSGTAAVGGLLGENTGSVVDSYATGSVSGDSEVGGLIGLNDGGNISQAHATGKVVGSGEHVGGLIGRHAGGQVASSYARGDVSGGNNVGGLIGRSDSGDIDHTYASGNVGGTAYVGGLIGRQAGGGLDGANAVGDVTGHAEVGGLVGQNNGSIRNAYATGAVEGAAGVGGLVGNNTGDISNAFATGEVKGSAAVGRLTGSNAGTVGNSFWNIEAAVSGVSESAQAAGAAGRTLVQLMQADTLAALNAGNTSAVWGNLENHSTPYLLAAPRTAAYLDSDLTVDGSANRPRLYDVILSMGNLQNIGENLNAFYVLGADLDASGFGHFQPIGGYFAGIFDGGNHTISGLEIDTGLNAYAALFAGTAASGVIRNVGILNARVEGYKWVGALVGENHGTVSNVWATVDISGIEATGGLVGLNYGVVRNARVTAGLVFGPEDVGGLVGRNHGSVEDAWTDVQTGGSAHVGGLVGANAGTIARSHANAGVQGKDKVGGLVGLNGGSIVDSHAAGAVVGTSGNSSHIGGLAGQNDGSIGSAYAAGSVTASGAGYVGGLVGVNNGSIDNAHASGLVSAPSVVTDWDAQLNPIFTKSRYVGGLVGINNGSSARISNAYATGKVLGSDYVGGLVGENNLGSISQTYAHGDVEAKGWGGGLAGNNSGNITESYASGDVSGDAPASEAYASTYLGGLVGRNIGSIANAYATGNISATNYYVSLLRFQVTSYQVREIERPAEVSVGGLVGYLGGGSISNAYAMGSVNGRVAENTKGRDLNVFEPGDEFVVREFDSPGSADVGGLIGYQYQGSINNAYWNQDLTGGYSGGLAEADIKKQSSFAGFDFDAVWRIYEGQSTPVLQSLQQGDLTITAASVDTIYDGATYSGGYRASLSRSDAALSGMVGFAGASQTAVNAGTYDIVPTLVTQQDYQNWNVNLVNGTLTITRAPLTVTANDAGKTYDGKAYRGGNDVTYAGFVDGEDAAFLGGSLTYGGDSQGAVGAGHYALTPAGLTSGNYVISFRDGILAIDRAPLTVTANDAGKTYDGKAYRGGNGVTYAGFVDGEDAAVLGGSLTYGGDSQGAVGAGGYVLMPAGLTSGNYVISFRDGELLIVAAPPPARPDASRDAPRIVSSNAVQTELGMSFDARNAQTEPSGSSDFRGFNCQSPVRAVSGIPGLFLQDAGLNMPHDGGAPGGACTL